MGHGSGASPQNATTTRYVTREAEDADVRHKLLLAFGARHDKSTKEYVMKHSPLSSDVPLSKHKLSIYQASAYNGEYRMKQFTKEVSELHNTTAEHSSHKRVESDLSVPRTKRELNYNKPLPESPESSQLRAYAEPGPEWSTSIEEWGWAWYLHIYLFAALYWFVAISSSAFIVLKGRFAGARRANTALKLSLHISLLFFSVSRALTLSIDPYDSQGIFGSMVVYVLWSAGFPIIVTSFGLLLLVLVDTTKLSLAPPKYQNFSLAIGIMGLNFAVVTATDLSVLLSAGSHAMMITCHVYLLVAGLTYTAGFMWVGHKISTRAVTNVTDNRLRRLRFLINVSAVISLSLISVQIYAAVAVFRVYSGLPDMIDPWQWYAVQTCLRSSEVGMCIVISMIFSSSANHRNNPAWQSPRIADTRVSPTLNEVRVEWDQSEETNL